MTFLRNKKILNLCLKWHILRSYYFVPEVTYLQVVELILAICVRKLQKFSLNVTNSQKILETCPLSFSPFFLLKQATALRKG